MFVITSIVYSSRSSVVRNSPTHPLTVARNWLWVVAPFNHQQHQMCRQQWVWCRAGKKPRFFGKSL